MNIENRPPVKYTPGHQDFHRIKYYQRLKENFKGLDQSLVSTPFHVIDPELLMTRFEIQGFKKGKTHGNLTMIFSVWNSLIGASLVTLPWAFSMAGLFLGIVICFICFIISFYTTYLVIKLAGKDLDFTDTLFRFFGKNGWTLGILTGITILQIPLMVYFQIICQMLYPLLLALIQDNKRVGFDLNPDFSQFSYSYTCIMAAIILYLLTLKKNLGIFIKINSYGVVFTFAIIIFVISVGIRALYKNDYSIVLTNDSWYNGTPGTPLASQTLQILSLQFAPLMGLISGGFYLHNISIPILANAKDPKRNVSNVFIGYFLAFISYLLCGVLGYIGFSSSEFNQSSIAQNCLNMFSSTNLWAIIIRICILLLLTALYPLLLALQRQQIWILYNGLMKNSKDLQSSFSKDQVKPITLKFLLLTNAMLIMGDSMVAIFYPNAGSLVAFLSSIFVSIMIYYIPPITHMMYLWAQSKSQILKSGSIQEKPNKNKKAFLEQLNNSNSSTNSSRWRIRDMEATPDKETYQNFDEKQQSKAKIAFMILLDVLILVFGMSVFSLQYIKF